MGVAEDKIRRMINEHEETHGSKPKYLILDSFIHERLRLEMKEGPDDTIGKLKNFGGVEVVLLRNSLVVS